MRKAAAIILGAALCAVPLAASADPMPVPKPKGGFCPPFYSSSGDFCIPQRDAGVAVAKPDSGSQCPSGYGSSGGFCVSKPYQYRDRDRR